jgi:hypothetical protein
MGPPARRRPRQSTEARPPATSKCTLSGGMPRPWNEALHQVTVKVGRGAGRTQRFGGILLGEWGHCTSNKVEVFGVARCRTGKYVVQVMRSQDWPARQDPRTTSAVGAAGSATGAVARPGPRQPPKPHSPSPTPFRKRQTCSCPRCTTSWRRCRTAAHWSHVKQVLQAHHGQAEDRACCGGRQ